MFRKVSLYMDRRKSKPWIVRWFGDTDPDTGEAKWYSKSFKAKSEAEEFQLQKTIEFRRGQQRDKPAELTLEKFCREWLKTAKPKLRPQTVRLYDHTIERLLKYFKPTQRLNRISPMMAEVFIAKLKPLERDDELSNWSRFRILRNCRTMFKKAVTWKLIAENPFQEIAAPTLDVTRWHYLKPKEYIKLLDATPSLLRKALYALAYTTGLRRGELLNLTWSDVDIKAGVVKVQNRKGTVTMPPFFIKDHEARQIKLPKHTLGILNELRADTKNSKGRVLLVPYVLLSEQHYRTVIAKWQRYRKQKRDWANRDMQNNTLRNFNRDVRRAGIKPDGQLSIHTLRKCCIKTWADHLPLNVTQTLAGHSDLKTTMQYYNQVDDYHRKKAADVMDQW
jgi:integrase